MRKKARSATLTVNDVAQASFTYDATNNHDPDGESGSASITISRP
jgi:hypothetical protein